ncbi:MULTISPECIES: hypothetical protein [unclassified Spirosoma]|uniref:hypothetical protein n=1 Tax=unclassified Spirosoma TaxID=2621999 RepID=UPI0009669D79|nr:MULTISPECIES: hypothetical protein [unclassified Spirosoma]MBN8824522.1 hypothetical protein [Spirosoma sp.]OJW70890.1 MAG: hypothetical protein BGO59_32200 [Spirosoma sp. 48-14]
MQNELPVNRLDARKAREILEALHGPALSEKESALATEAMDAKFRAEVARQLTLRREEQKLTRPLLEHMARLAPYELTEKVKAEREAFLHRLPHRELSALQPSESAILIGSLIALFAPPYDAGATASNQEAWAKPNIGEIHVRAQEIGSGSSAHTAQIGKWFRPIADGLVRFRTNVQYWYDWWSSASFYTAHNHGFIGVFIFENTNGRNILIRDERRLLWNDGVGWLDSHHDSADSWQLFDIPFGAKRGSAYFLGVWCGCWMDADDGFGGFSAASADLTCRVPLIAVKTQ